MKKTAPRQYIAIDLKSFYASVECVERGLDPLDTNLVVADASRTDKTICLAVSPSLKAFGTGGRPRMFEVIRRIRDVNRQRAAAAPAGRLRALSNLGSELQANPDLGVGYLVAPPRMSLYLDYSARVYGVYLRYIAPDDIHVYSVDEVFIDATGYLSLYKMSAHELAMTMVREVLAETGITATAGIGDNLYLAKVAMDIVAKKKKADADGVRIASLSEADYRRQLWDHTPLTDFWRVGHGTADRLAKYGIFTMGDIARCSIHHDDLLYRLFGVNAELLIDHAWGWEPVEMHHIKAYRPEATSTGSSQVLTEPYTCAKARNVMLEMADSLSLDLLAKGMETKKIVITIGYDAESLTRPEIRDRYRGKITSDHYGRPVPAHSHGTANLSEHTAGEEIVDAAAHLFDRLADTLLLVRRLSITACDIRPGSSAPASIPDAPVQLELFVDYDQLKRQKTMQRQQRERDTRRRMAVIDIKNKFGKNAIMTGKNFADGATQRQRNGQIGGHKA